MQPGQGMPQAAGYPAQQYPQYQQQGQFPPQQGPQQAGGALPQYQHQPLQFGAPPTGSSGGHTAPQQPPYGQRK